VSRLRQPWLDIRLAHEMKNLKGHQQKVIAGGLSEI